MQELAGRLATLQAEREGASGERRRVDSRVGGVGGGLGPWGSSARALLQALARCMRCCTTLLCW